MQIKKKIIKLNKLYIIFLSFVLFINIILTTSLSANTFKITDIEISKPFDLKFNKEKILDSGFKKAFIELLSMITTSGDKKKLINTPLPTIKGLIDSFTMSDEKFIDDEYFVKFDVNFNKKNTLQFFEKNNIFPSVPKKKKLMLIPIIVDIESDKIYLFNKNIFYERWNQNNKSFFLLNYLLPSEDLDDVNILSQNSKSIEDYDFKEITKKYDLNDYIVVIIYKNNDKLKILSKINFNKSYKIDNQQFNKINLSIKDDFDLVTNKLKITYENYWKSINQINTSIKLPLTVSLKSYDYEKIQIFQTSLDQLDLVSSYEILRFNNKNVYFKVIYNGSPNKFLNNMRKKKIIIETENQTWEIK